jgi:hypothetical protein
MISGIECAAMLVSCLIAKSLLQPRSLIASAQRPQVPPASPAVGAVRLLHAVTMLLVGIELSLRLYLSNRVIGRVYDGHETDAVSECSATSGVRSEPLGQKSHQSVTFTLPRSRQKADGTASTFW